MAGYKINCEEEIEAVKKNGNGGKTYFTKHAAAAADTEEIWR